MFSVTYLEILGELFFFYSYSLPVQIQNSPGLIKIFESQVFLSVGVFYSYHSPSILAFNYRILLNKFWLSEREGKQLELTLI